MCGLKPNRVIKKYNRKLSHPSWVCGLKLTIDTMVLFVTLVTPFVGVWIETEMGLNYAQAKNGHTLRGCVD